MCTTRIKQAEKGKFRTANNFVYMPPISKFCFYWNDWLCLSYNKCKPLTSLIYSCLRKELSALQWKVLDKCLLNEWWILYVAFPFSWSTSSQSLVSALPLVQSTNLRGFFFYLPVLFLNYFSRPFPFSLWLDLTHRTLIHTMSFKLILSYTRLCLPTPTFISSLG